ncbi:MAG: ABC transporter ATP-binding protein [Marvinbryantia sp.]|uniref:ABC transporter ATP-binding protein n=1 Tax=Marvinbryantia sp. TaxID=2496532 RepID=UPI0025E1D6E2|nr:ABC transporter ATP-binding protein [uncultured Marvinbryantia sp.]
MLKFDHIGMKYKTLTGYTEALVDVNFDVNDGEFVTVLGPSGCGKSTFLFIGTGLTAPTSGRAVLDGNEITKPVKEVGFVFQDHLLLEWRTVLQNIMIQGEFRNLDKAVTKQKAMELIRQVGLEGFENKYPWELSGGMQQRVSICRALVHEPELLMMDEPYGALDALTREQMRVDLEKMWMQKKCTILFVTHDIDEAIMLADKVVILTPRPGRVKSIIPIDLPRPRNLAVKESREFLAYRKEITGIFTEMGILKED